MDDAANRPRTSSVVSTLRWLAVLPAAAGVYAAIGLLFYIIGGGHPDALMTLTNYCISPAAFVFCGAYVAPSRRFVTAIVLTMLLAITMTALFTWSATARGYDDWLGTGKSVVWAVLGFISSLAASFFILRSEQQKKEIQRLLEEERRKHCDSDSGEILSKIA